VWVFAYAIGSLGGCLRISAGGMNMFLKDLKHPLLAPHKGKNS